MRLLVVGAGGVGCELLKTLLLCDPVCHIDVVDFDTIETSNLNRQFLFTRADRGRHKSTTAVAKLRNIMTGAPGTTITAHTGSIFDWGIKEIQNYDAVFTALDNVPARKHLNRICLAINKPMIDGGTGGLFGQAQMHIGKVTDCYECKPPAKKEIIPVCTIRSKPTEPKHCIVWAKLAFEYLFGSSTDDVIAADGSGKIPRWARDAPAILSFSSAANTPAAGPLAWIRDVLAGAFGPVPHVAGLPVVRPESIDFAELEKELTAQQANAAQLRQLIKSDTKVWPLAVHLHALLAATRRLCGRHPAGEAIAFDKDDDDSMAVVHVLANFRATCFNIPLLSLHDCKGIAGSIVPSLCTTNAIIAAAMVHEWVNGVRDKVGPPRCTRVFKDPVENVLVMNSRHGKPNPACFVCSTQTVSDAVDFDIFTIERFVREIVVGKYNLRPKPAPSVVFEPDGIFDEEDWGDVTLASGGVVAGNTVTCYDGITRIKIVLNHQAAKPEEALNPDDAPFDENAHLNNSQMGEKEDQEQQQQKSNDPRSSGDQDNRHSNSNSKSDNNDNDARDDDGNDDEDFERKRTDRQRRVWGDRIQGLLAGSTIAIVGGGPVAAEIAKNFALIGVRRLVLVDLDPAALSPADREAASGSTFLNRGLFGETTASEPATLNAINPSVEILRRQHVPVSADAVMHELSNLVGASAPDSNSNSSSSGIQLIVVVGLPQIQWRAIGEQLETQRPGTKFCLIGTELVSQGTIQAFAAFGGWDNPDAVILDEDGQPLPRPPARCFVPGSAIDPKSHTLLPVRTLLPADWRGTPSLPVGAAVCGAVVVNEFIRSLSERAEPWYNAIEISFHMQLCARTMQCTSDS